ncbi:MAG TPA: PAS domain-containing protein, partial [Micavibrio sp.]
MLQGTRLHVLIFLAVAVAAMSGLAGAYYIKDRAMSDHGYEVTASREIIIQTQESMVLLFNTLAVQRGYLLSGNRELLSEYDYNKARLSEALARLKVLTRNYPAQASRIDELQHHYLQFSELLDAMMQRYKTERNLGSVKELNQVDDVRKAFDRVASKVLDVQKETVTAELTAYYDAKGDKYRSLAIGLFLTLLILTILNAYLILIQASRNVGEDALREAEERLRLAIRGTNDGVYDWNLLTQEIYWSPQFKGLLGYQDDEVVASRPFLETLIHPDDKEMAAESTKRYLNRETPELSVTFRVKHRDGYWIWVQKRGKALFDEDGRAVRLTGTYSDITSLKEYECKLEEARDVAEKANAAKTEFLAHMSHEIRTPLTSVSGVSEILMSQKESFSEKHQQLIKVLAYSTLNLKELINDILDFSKIESGQMELESKPFMLGELFQEVISIMSVRAHEKGLKF